MRRPGDGGEVGDERVTARAELRRREESLVLSGELSFDTVKRLLDEGCEAIESMSVDKAVLDLSAVTKADSAGLALVVAWIRSARQRGFDLQITGVPTQLAAIARVSGLENFLAGAR